MPIDVQCNECGQRLRVADKLAGKHGNCPKCKTKLTIPNPAAESQSLPTNGAAAAKVAQTAGATAQTSARKSGGTTTLPDEWSLQTADGERYGPISRAELDEWFAEGRVVGECQILRPGSEEWVPAATVYDSLSEPAPDDSVPEETEPDDAAPGDATPDEATAFPVVKKRSQATPIDEEAFGTASRAMRETWPWAMFLAILGFVSGGLNLLGGMGSLAMMAMSKRFELTALLMTALYMAFGGLTLYGSFNLVQYATCGKAFAKTPALTELNAALNAQRNFWRTAGMIAVIMIVTTIMFVLFIVVLAFT